MQFLDQVVRNLPLLWAILYVYSASPKTPVVSSLDQNWNLRIWYYGKDFLASCFFLGLVIPGGKVWPKYRDRCLCTGSSAQASLFAWTPAPSWGRCLIGPGSKGAVPPTSSHWSFVVEWSDAIHYIMAGRLDQENIWKYDDVLDRHRFGRYILPGG